MPKSWFFLTSLSFVALTLQGSSKTKQLSKMELTIKWRVAGEYPVTITSDNKTLREVVLKEDSALLFAKEFVLGQPFFISIVDHTQYRCHSTNNRGKVKWKNQVLFICEQNRIFTPEKDMR